MNIAIYARKSKLTDKGDSIGNQVKYCQSYIASKPDFFLNPQVTTYFDDGFSGGNMNRPQFTQLLQDIRKGDFDVLICYKLDRISRSVSDFSTTYKLLEDYGVQFISVADGFDTTSKNSKLLLQISSVFAEFERDTITERISDAMLQLALSGHWSGGSTPIGYIAQKTLGTDTTGRHKKYTILTVDKCHAATIQLIYHQYIALGSISQVEAYLMQNHIKTPDGNYYSASVLNGILRNPVYAPADDALYAYFEKHHAHMAYEACYFNGKTAIMPYNRTHKKGNRTLKNPITQWIISIGQHLPLITSNLWLKTQTLLDFNKEKAIPKGSAVALLTGIFYCKHCGAPMIVRNQTTLADGTISYIYKCHNKVISRRQICNIPNCRGHFLDPQVIHLIQNMVSDPTLLIQNLALQKKQLQTRCGENSNLKNNIIKAIHDANTKMTHYAMRIAKLDPSDSLIEIYEQNIRTLQKQIQALQQELDDYATSHNNAQCTSLDIDALSNKLIAFTSALDHASMKEKRHLLREIIKRIEWDGQNVTLYFYQKPIQS